MAFVIGPCLCLSAVMLYGQVSPSPLPASGTAPVAVPAKNEASTALLVKDNGVLASDSFRNCVALFQAAAAIVNIICVVWIFKQNTGIRDKERVADARERVDKLKLETMSFWIQKLIMEPANKQLHDFFNRWASALAEPEPIAQGVDPGAQAKKEIGEFNADLRLIRDRVEEPLVLVSKDFNKIGTILTDLQDVVTGFIQKRYLGIEMEASREKPEDAFRRLRRTFFAKIYEVHRAVVNL